MKKFTVIYLMLLPAFIGSVFGAVPTITNFSSIGGNPNNKDNDQDIMYLVQSGDNVVFTITVDQPVSYEWAVNKSTEAGRVATTPTVSDTFNWVVPDGKAIWEIHLRCWNVLNEEVHKEWVVSTLSSGEAPDFFDYFADFLYKNRTEKDPWNRELKNWVDYPIAPTLADASHGFLHPSGSADGRIYPRTDVAIPYGTWKFKYRYPEGNTGAWGFNFYYAYQSGVTYNSYYGKSADTHHHCSVPRGLPKGGPFSIDYDGGGWNEDGRWHEVTIVRTADTWVYMYVDGKFEYYAQDHLNELNPDKIMLDTQRYLGHEVQFDGFEIYQNKYLYPATEIKYQEYIWNYYVNDYYHYPEKKSGIVVKGKGVTLSDIAGAVGPDYLEKSGNTYICKTDLVFDIGTEFKMENEILKFRSNFNGERQLVIKYGAEITINNSTITSENDFYYIWNNACSTTHFASMGGEIFTGWSEKAYGLWPINHSGYLRFSVNNSTIEKTAHLFFDSPYELKINQTKFNSLSEVDIGNYTVTRSYNTSDRREREWYRGNKSFYLALDDLNINNFELSDISFSGESSPINVTFLLNAIRDKLNIYNLDLPNENIVLKKPLPQQYGQSHSLSWFRIHAVDKNYDGLDCKVGLVNCRFQDLKIEKPIETVSADRTSGAVKYFLDVKVVDQAGNPVEDAGVTVVNEIDDTNYPAENCEEKQDWWDPPVAQPDPVYDWQKFYLHRHITQGLPVTSVQTKADGHTPLPDDKINTLIVADYVKDQNTRTNFIYTITAEKYGVSGQLIGVDPDESWYRPDPNLPVQTVVVRLGVKTDARLDESKGSVVYPNPYIKGKSSGEKITFANLLKDATIRVYTSAGKLVAEIEHQADVDGGLEEWDVSNVNSGIYLYVITSPSGTKKGKVSIIK